MSLNLSDTIAVFIKKRKEAKLAPLVKTRDETIKKSANQAEVSDANNLYTSLALPIEKQFEPIEWITQAASKAKAVSFSTHSAKFLNSSAKSTGGLVTNFDESKPSHLITENIKIKSIDAIGGAGVVSIAKLMMLTVDGDSLINQVKNGHVDALKAFTKDESLLKMWFKGFEKALTSDEIKSDNLGKQVFLPVGNTGCDSKDYHILCPLFPSTLAHELHRAVSSSRFDEESVLIRGARRNNQFHEKLDTFFPFTAVQMFGGSQPQNVSLLNQERLGKCYLLDCSPPQVDNNQAPPCDVHSIFSGDFESKASFLVRDFRIFLTGLTEKDRVFKTRYKRDYAFIERIIDTLFNYVASVQDSTKYAGWSNDTECETKREHALWLDVYSPVPVFQNERESGAWIDVVADDFTFWLLSKLESEKHYTLGKLEERYIKKIFLNEIKAFEAQTPKLGGI